MSTACITTKIRVKTSFRSSFIYRFSNYAIGFGKHFFSSFRHNITTSCLRNVFVHSINACFTAMVWTKRIFTLMKRFVISVRLNYNNNTVDTCVVFLLVTSLTEKMSVITTVNQGWMMKSLATYSASVATSWMVVISSHKSDLK